MALTATSVASSSSSSSSSSLLLLFSISLSILISSCFCDSTTASFKGIDAENPVVNITPSPLGKYSFGDVSKEAVSCERVKVSGYARSKLRSYANSFRVTLAPSVVIPERIHNKIHVCFHRNVSLGMCECENDEWKVVQSGSWTSVMSPYEDRYVDVKFVGGISGTVTVSVKEDFQRWRLLCLAMGFILLLLAPIVSSWVPFYYSSSMAIGVFLVVIILLFQGMKLMPTGRKNFFYLTIYGSVIGAGSFLLHQFSVLVNAILVNFGLSEEMHNPVSILLLVGVILAGAALGYWVVRKYIISEDGSVDAGIAQFVKWAMRIIAITLIFQSTLDTPLAVGALTLCLVICYLITSMLHSQEDLSYLESKSPWLRKAKNATTPPQNRAQFFSKKLKTGPRGDLWSNPKTRPAFSNPPVRGLRSPLGSSSTRNQQDYYSTYHKNPKQKRFSKKEYEEFTLESTRQGMADLTSSPNFTNWVIENADRIKVLPDDSSDESMESGSDSNGEMTVGSGSNRVGLFNW